MNSVNVIAIRLGISQIFEAIEKASLDQACLML
ncbi:hypothetical protein QE390_005116 [Siphonobacter sp. SORGH_AS 1065]|nr:hypothetical protein [Siphonobacter sp. SORGH_AS_1065]